VIRPEIGFEETLFQIGFEGFADTASHHVLGMDAYLLAQAIPVNQESAISTEADGNNGQRFVAVRTVFDNLVPAQLGHFISFEKWTSAAVAPCPKGWFSGRRPGLRGKWVERARHFFAGGKEVASVFAGKKGNPQIEAAKRS
jgi:hypothetical protein